MAKRRSSASLPSEVRHRSPQSVAKTAVMHNEPMEDGGLARPVPSAGTSLSTPRPPWRLGNRPALTGIRAPGVATVLIFHSNFRTLPGAWASLGLFFVLSGFLITAMLAGEHQRTGGISLKNFYSRRAFRLLPPLFIIVALLAIYASIVHVRMAATELWTDVAAAVFYFADYRSALGHEPPIGYLSQCWSLAVEEQFYLVWAILFFVVLRSSNRRLAYVIAIVGVLASVADRMFIVLTAPRWDSLVAGRVYYAFDTRADALFIGCLLGLVATGGHLDGWGPTAKRLVSVAALASTAAMFWIYFNVGLAARSLPLVWLPVSELAAVGIITFLLIHPKSLTGRVLSLPLLVLLGNMSYAIYLYHWPVYVAISPWGIGMLWPYWEAETVRLVIVMALAFASWFLVEKRLMIWRRKVFSDGGRRPVAEADGHGPEPPPVSASGEPSVSATPSEPSQVPAANAARRSDAAGVDW